MSNDAARLFQEDLKLKYMNLMFQGAKNTPLFEIKPQFNPMDHTKNPKDYVLGFAFSKDRKRVALIHKLTPAWQHGKLNGIGGKIEEREDAFMAMEREFGEETGLHVPRQYWQCYAQSKGHGWNMYVFRAFLPDEELNQVRTMEKEEVEIFAVDSVISSTFPLKLMDSLGFLIPLALHTYEARTGLRLPIQFDYDSNY